jgi:hypothetical protein
MLGATPLIVLLWAAVKTVKVAREFQDRAKIPWGEETPFRCPVCGSWKTIGHRPNCKLGRDLLRYQPKENSEP